MKKKNITTSLVFLAITVSGIPGIAFPVFAQTAASSPSGMQVEKSAKQTERMAKIISKANQEIDRRITELNKLIEQVGNMKRVSAQEKASLASMVQTQIADLNSVKTKIDADTDIETLRTDVKSITISYRIYALVIPRGHILVAADRLRMIANMMSETAIKLETRISTAKTAGKDVAALESALADLKTKIADALTQAAAAESTVALLTPDLGDATQMKNNKNALMDSRTKIKAGRQDVNAARKDARTIVEGIRKLKPSPSPSVSASPAPSQ